MLSNYFTLFHIARQLNERYAECVIAQVYSQEKHSLNILLYSPEPVTITVHCTARDNYLLARLGDLRSRTNSVDLFPELIDRHIRSVSLSVSDRTVLLRFTEGMTLCIDMFASKANVMLCDDAGTVKDVFLNKKDFLGIVRTVPAADRAVTAEDVLPAPEQFTAAMEEKGDPVRILKSAVPKLGSILAAEVLFRADADQWYSRAKGLVDRLLRWEDRTVYLYFDDRAPVCFSLIALESYAGYRCETFDDLFSAARMFVGAERSSSHFLQKKKELESWLTKERDKAMRTIAAVEHELAESSRAEVYELSGTLIMTHLSSLTKGITSAELENPFTQERVIVQLDKALSPQKNAERYFEKAKKSRTGREESHQRLKQLKERMTSVNDLLEKSKGVTDSISLKNFLHSFGGTVKELGFMTDKEQAELPPFKIFAVEGGFTVYAGKNSANNDELTFRYAKPNDLWFHARGSSGSHVVLKIGSAQGTPSKKAIHQAAAIAAYYSKMKNAKHVPVAMTERKHIRKPKGAPAGTVALEKEKVIFVEPVLPGNEV